MKFNYIVFSFLIFFLFGLFCQVCIADKLITEQQIIDKARGMWLGQIIANYAGRATEGDYSGSLPNPEPNVPWILKEVWDADDDTDIEYIALHILETNGFDCNSQELADQWRDHITGSGIYISNRQAWYLMHDGYLPQLTGSRQYNMHWYSIDSQITTEVLGAISPGLPQHAMDLTSKFAHISNEGFPTHAAQFYAAMYSYAFFESDINNLIDKSLEAIPTTSRTYAVITDIKNWYFEDINDGTTDWRATRKKLYDHYQGSYSNGRYYNWIESTINTGATVLCLLYGQGDFKETAQIGILAGWDCDCNPATAAGIIGIINGYSGLPSDLTDPNFCGDIYKNIYRPYIPDANVSLPQYDTITNIASRIAALAEQNILSNGGYISYTPEKTYHLPDSNTALIPAPEKPDPNGPVGLVAKAIEAGITVTPESSVQYYNTTDRRNLYAIIDGIKDNSYNGHRPYYTYLSDPDARPEKDFYQLSFDSKIRFDSITFYEGDIVWNGINTYCKNDTSRGGFFNDLTVEIFQDGTHITPSNIQQSEPLCRYKMYQIIEFTFEPTTGTAIRIIGSAGGSNSFTTIMELQAQGSTTVDTSYLGIFAKHWLKAADDPAMDINRDGIINFTDFAALADKWQKNY